MSNLLYSLLLRLYPRAFRDRYGAEMMRLFGERLRDEDAFRVWLDVLADAAVSVPRQHLQTSRPHPMFPPSAAPLRWIVLPGLIAGALTGGGLVASLAFFVHGAWLLALVMVCAALFGFTRGIRSIRKARAVKAYRVDVDAHHVTVACQAIGISPHTVQRAEVTGLHVWEKIGLRIQTADPSRDLWVPESAPAYADVKERLSQWAPVTTTPFGVAFRGNMNVPQLIVACALAAFLPIAFARGIATAFAVYVVIGLVRRDVPTFKLALMAAPVFITLVRWFW